MKVKIRYSSTRKFVLTLKDDTLGTLKDAVREFIRQTYQEDVREPLGVSLNGKDALDGEDDTRLSSLGVVPGDLLTVIQHSTVTQAHSSTKPSHSSTSPSHSSTTPSYSSTKTKTAPPPPMPTPPPEAMSSGSGEGVSGEAKGGGDGGGGGGESELLMDAVDGVAPRSLDELFVKCSNDGGVSLSGGVNLVLHLTMLECGFHLDSGGDVPQGWSESVAVFGYCSDVYPAFKCKLVLMDVGGVKQVMASFPGQVGEVKHSVTMSQHVTSSHTGNTVMAKDLVRVAVLSRQLRDAVLMPLQVAAHEGLGVPPPWHLAGLPQELLLVVATRLDHKSVVAMASTCRHLRFLLTDNRLWYELFRRDFPNKVTTDEQVTKSCWKDRYRHEYRQQKQQQKLRDDMNDWVTSGYYPPVGPFLPYPGGVGPHPLHPRPTHPFTDPDSPYFQGEVPHVPGVYPHIPDPLGPLGPLHPGQPDPLGPLGPINPRQPPFLPPGRPGPRIPRGPRFDFFM